MRYMAKERDDMILFIRDRVETQVQEGNWAEAEETANSTITTFKERYKRNPVKVGDYARALEIKANIRRDQGNKGAAKKLYCTVVELLRETEGYWNLCGRVGANLASIHEDDDEIEEARSFYQWSLDNLQYADPPMPLERAGVYNNLAYLYERDHHLDEAEQLFLHALEINQAELGPKDSGTADVLNNLGGLYYRSGEFSQALEMHKGALDIRKEALGVSHFDTAQSHGNLALAYAALENIDEAVKNFDYALKILEKSKESDITDYAIVSSNFIYTLRELGHDKDADKVEKRTTKYLKNH